MPLFNILFAIFSAISVQRNLHIQYMQVSDTQ